MNGLEILFPNLRPGNYLVTSSRDVRYNCIAWAAGENTRRWWPILFGYWPRDVPRESTMAAFIAAFGKSGYSPAPEGRLESGVEKIAIYVDASGEPTHAARQLPSGKWTSKLGQLEDIEHDLPALEGGDYGHVACYLKRPRE